MALIQCPECGKEMSDKAKKCPNCGFPLPSSKEFVPSKINIDQNNSLTMNNKKKKDSSLSVLALIFSIFGCGFVSIVGFVLGVIDLALEDRSKQHRWSKVAIGVFAGWIFVWACVFFGTDLIIDNKEQPVEEKNIVHENMSETTNFTSKIIWEENDCIITLIKGDDKTLNFQIENNSSKDYDFAVHSMSVNGIMTNCNIYTMDTEVPAGKKANATLDILEYSNQFSDLEYVDLLFWIYDNNKGMKDYETDIIHLETNKYSGTDYIKKYSKNQEINGITVSLDTLEKDKFVVCIKNNNDYYIDIDINNMSFNDWAYDTTYEFYIAGVQIYPNCQAKFEMDIKPEFLQSNNIEEITDCEFSIEMREKGDYFKSLTTDKIKFDK